jgi:hypothetical protein
MLIKPANKTQEIPMPWQWLFVKGNIILRKKLPEGVKVESRINSNKGNSVSDLDGGSKIIIEQSKLMIHE